MSTCQNCRWGKQVTYIQFWPMCSQCKLHLQKTKAYFFPETKLTEWICPRCKRVHHIRNVQVPDGADHPSGVSPR